MKPIDIGNRLELFVDDFLIDSLEGAELRLAQPAEQPLGAAEADVVAPVLVPPLAPAVERRLALGGRGGGVEAALDPRELADDGARGGCRGRIAVEEDVDRRRHGGAAEGEQAIAGARIAAQLPR